MDGDNFTLSAFAVYRAEKKGSKEKDTPKRPKKSKKGSLETKAKRLKPVEDLTPKKVQIIKSKKGLQQKKINRSAPSDLGIKKRSSSSGNMSSSKKRKATKDQDLLDGDDVPLVEEAIGEMHDSIGWSDHDGASVNGDNFLSTVLNANNRVMTSSGEFISMKVTNKRTNKRTKKVKDDLDNEDDLEEGDFMKRLRAKFASSGQVSFSSGDEGATTEKASPDPGSVELGKKCLASLIGPVTVDQFFEEFWERRPLHIRRGEPDHYAKRLPGGQVFSTKTFDRLLRNPDQPVLFGKNLDVTSYSEEVGRETHNPPEGGRAYAPVVWDYYNNGCSLRLLNPQTFHEPVWRLCATLQEFFGCMVGANVYLTPPGTQGFAPHYDDVEVFVLQLEGKKHWRVYDPPPRSQLARNPSKDFRQEEVKGQEAGPCLDVVLEAGDLLYMPRGTIHQGDCMETHHSLHITVSCYQLNTYGDLLERLVPAALAVAQEEDVEFRRGLPVDFLRHLGVVHNDKGSSSRRGQVLATLERLMQKLFSYAPVDAAADQLGKRFAHDSLPPCLSPSEVSRCVEGGGEKWSPGKARVVNVVEIDPEDEVRLIRAHSVRVVTEDDNAVRLYYNVENSREYRQIDPQFLEIDADTAPAVEALIDTYPNYIAVDKLPIEPLDLKMKFVQDLWERKLLLTKKPLEAHYDD